MPLTASQINAMTCESPGCDHGVRTGHELILEARCHPEGGTQASYRHGVLHIECKTCGQFVCEVAVAP